MEIADDSLHINIKTSFMKWERKNKKLDDAK